MDPFLRRERRRFRLLAVGVVLGGIDIAWHANHPAHLVIIAVVAVLLWLAVCTHYHEDAMVARAWRAYDRASRPRRIS